MEMFGKVVAPKRTGGLNLNGNAELLLNSKSNRVTLSGSLLTKLGWADKAIGFGYDPEKTLGEATVYIYGVDNIEEGCKVGKSGTVTNKFHSEKLGVAFVGDLNGANRSKLDVDADNPITHETGVVMYPVTFLETLKDINRTAKASAADLISDVQIGTTPYASIADQEDAPTSFETPDSVGIKFGH